MGTVEHFDYDAAFSRNIGWLRRSEQRQLRNKTVAIAGMGGVVGARLVSLTLPHRRHGHVRDRQPRRRFELRRNAADIVATGGPQFGRNRAIMQSPKCTYGT